MTRKPTGLITLANINNCSNTLPLAFSFNPLDNSVTRIQKGRVLLNIFYVKGVFVPQTPRNSIWIQGFSDIAFVDMCSANITDVFYLPCLLKYLSMITFPAIDHNATFKLKKNRGISRNVNWCISIDILWMQLPFAYPSDIYVRDYFILKFSVDFYFYSSQYSETGRMLQDTDWGFWII